MIEETFDWVDLVNRYRELATSSHCNYGPAHSHQQQRINNGNEWIGDSKKAILERLDNGFVFPEMDEELLPHALEEENRWYYTDDSSDAEYQYDLDEIGESDFYLARRQTKSKPGIRINVAFCFRSNVDAHIIGQYGAWVGAAIQALQANGYDMEITLFNVAERLINRRDTARTNIRVSKFGELKMTSDWAPMFSPGGYRHLNFLSRCLLEDKGYDVNTGMGASKDYGYKVGWDNDTRTLTITSSSTAGSFNANLMNAQLAAARDSIIN